LNKRLRPLAAVPVPVKAIKADVPQRSRLKAAPQGFAGYILQNIELIQPENLNSDRTGLCSSLCLCASVRYCFDRF